MLKGLSSAIEAGVEAGKEVLDAIAEFGAEITDLTGIGAALRIVQRPQLGTLDKVMATTTAALGSLDLGVNIGLRLTDRASQEIITELLSLQNLYREEITLGLAGYCAIQLFKLADKHFAEGTQRASIAGNKDILAGNLAMTAISIAGGASMATYTFMEGAASLASFIPLQFAKKGQDMGAWKFVPPAMATAAAGFNSLFIAHNMTDHAIGLALAAIGGGLPFSGAESKTTRIVAHTACTIGAAIMIATGAIKIRDIFSSGWNPEAIIPGIFIALNIIFAKGKVKAVLNELNPSTPSEANSEQGV